MKTTIKSQLFRMDLHKSLSHELGHYFVALHYNESPSIVIWRSGTSNQSGERTVLGSCSYAWKTPFQRSCVGWAGEIATIIFESSDISDEELFASVLEQWEESREDFSITDVEAINTYRVPTRSLKKAIAILSDNAETLRAKVGELSGRFEKERLERLQFP